VLNGNQYKGFKQDRKDLIMYYHGTTDTLYRAIQKDGLKYSPMYRWKMYLLTDMLDGRVTRYNPSDRDDPGYVYVTDRWQKAMWYATNKALYLNTTPNTDYAFIPLDDRDGLDFERYSPARKLDGPYMPGSNPCVLQVNTDKYDISTDWHDSQAYRVRGIIQPKDIKLVWEGQLVQQLLQRAA
jgi:hypothetical protein